MVKKLPANAGDLCVISGSGRSSGGGHGAHSGILAWRIPWTEKLAGYSPLVCKESDTSDLACTLTQERRNKKKLI